jgi:hypothetical protein
MFVTGCSASAVAEKLDRGYLGRILMLTLLAPDIVQAIMDGRQPAELGVHVLRVGFPVEWEGQRAALALVQRLVCRHGRLGIGIAGLAFSWSRRNARRRHIQEWA